MVSVNQNTFHRNSSSKIEPRHLLTILGIFVGIYIVGTVYILTGSTTTSSTGTTYDESSDRQLRTERVNRSNRPQSVQVVLDESQWEHEPSCSYKSLDDLSPSELYPQKGERHMIDPPAGGKVSLVCCETTVGYLNIVAREKWAPLGSARFLDMVTSGYFDSGVPLMRCVKGFLCQFGLNADNSKKGDFRETIEDDPNWLPEGPTGRENEQGVKRFALGYMAYAGAGKKSRSNQLIVALKANGPLAGGSPWEVPWGELVHPESFETLSKIYTGYGEKGPPQGQLGPKGMTEEMKAQWPKLDYIKKCHLVEERDLPEHPPEPT